MNGAERDPNDIQVQLFTRLWADGEDSRVTHLSGDEVFGTTFISYSSVLKLRRKLTSPCERATGCFHP